VLPPIRDVAGACASRGPGQRSVESAWSHHRLLCKSSRLRCSARSAVRTTRPLFDADQSRPDANDVG